MVTGTQSQVYITRLLHDLGYTFSAEHSTFTDAQNVLSWYHSWSLAGDKLCQRQVVWMKENLDGHMKHISTKNIPADELTNGTPCALLKGMLNIQVPSPPAKPERKEMLPCENRYTQYHTIPTMHNNTYLNSAQSVQFSPVHREQSAYITAYNTTLFPYPSLPPAPLLALSPFPFSL
jgi:hypothetical protein